VAELLEEHSDDEEHEEPEVEAVGPHTAGFERNGRGITFITDNS